MHAQAAFSRAKQIGIIIRIICNSVYVISEIFIVHVIIIFNLDYIQGPNTPSMPSQIELILLTARPPTSVRTLVQQVANHLDLRHLRTISAVCISDPTSTILDATLLQSTSAENMATSGGQSTSGGYGSGGQSELSQQFECGSPSELSEYNITS